MADRNELERPIRTPDEIMRDALCEEIRDMLSECTEKQRETFDRVFPGGLSKQSVASLKNAILLCQRTLRASASGTT